VVRSTSLILCALVAGLSAATARAQFTVPVTSFELDRDGNPFVIGSPAGYSTFEEVMFHDPQFSTTTLGYILAKGAFDDVGCVGCVLPEDSLEESYVESTLGGANGTSQALITFFSWSVPTDTARWAHVTTRHPPAYPSPAIHMGGKVRLRLRINDAGFSASNLNLAFALMVRETGTSAPLGHNGGLVGAIEFVGVSGLLDPGTTLPTPLADPSFTYAGPTSTGDNNFVMVEFDLPALATAGKVFGWTNTGGDGVLDGVRGTLEGLVIIPVESGASFRDVQIMIDEVEFEAPVDDDAIAPRFEVPIIDTSTSVKVNDVLYSSTNVSLEIDRSYDGVTFVADEVINTPVTNVTNVTVGPFGALQIGDAVRANQTTSTGTGPYSSIITITPPPIFTITLSLDEDGNLGAAPADFEYVGATAVSGTATPRGKPVFGDCATWQNVEFSLTGGDPVINFAGGDGFLSPDGGMYNIDAIFLSSGTVNPSAGPFRVYIDHIYYRDSMGNEQLISNAETVNPFGAFRGQSSPVAAATSILTGTTSYDGQNSNRIDWTWSAASGDNVLAPFRPATAFPDSAQAVGLWLMVEDCSVVDPVRPNIVAPVIGNSPAVTINGLDATNTTDVSLFINGLLDSTVSVSGVTTTDIDPVNNLVLGDILTATHTTGVGESDPSLPRPVLQPAPPAVNSPLIAGQTSVTVNNLNTSDVAGTVQVFAEPATAISAATVITGASMSINVAPPLALGQIIYAVQTINGATSERSVAVAVGTGVVRRVVINEFQYDDGGTDDREFIEIYNAEDEAVDISGWVVRAYDAVGPPGDDNPDYTIPDATILAAGDFYVLGHAAVPNVDQVLPSGERFENDNEITELLDENGIVIDSIITERNKGPVASAGEGGIWGNFQSVDDQAGVTATPHSLSRWFDGLDTDSNGRDFGYILATPGATNAPVVIDFYRGPDVDSLTPGVRVPDLNGSFDDAFVVDPTVGPAAPLDGANDVNPYAIPASPQGGNAVIAWDPSGGGNVTTLSSTMNADGSYDIWVYVDTALVTGMTEQWNIGLAGTVDTGLQNNLTLGANGSTGVSWRYLRSATAVTLALVDHGPAGGPIAGWNVLGTLDLVAQGYASGWYRLAIHVCGNKVTGLFDDQVITGSSLEADLVGTFYIGYREDMAGTPLTVRPPTIDMRAMDDCNANEVDDLAEIAAGTADDCNCNGIPDACEITDGAPDANGNNVPDDCELGACCGSGNTCSLAFEADCASGYVCDVTALSGQTCFADADANGTVNAADRGQISANIGQTANDLLCQFDLDGNGVVNAADRGQVSANIGLCNSLPNYQNGSGLNAAGNGPDPRFPSSSTFLGAGSDCAQCADSCGDAAPLADGIGAITGNSCNQDAADDAEASCQASSNRDVFYAYTASCTGTVTIDTEGSRTLADTVLTVFDGCGGNEVACDDDGGSGFLSTVSFAAIEDTAYVIRVAGFGITCGEYSLNVTCTP
jgi:hypothetical protein